MKRLQACLIGLVAMTLLMALASYWTTHRQGENDWPAVEMRIMIADERGTPVSDAKLLVVGGEEDRSEFAKAYLYPQNPLSDASGLMVVFVRPFRWKYDNWQLFWLIPIGTFDPNLDAKIVADGFQPHHRKLRALIANNLLGQKRDLKATENEMGFPSDEQVELSNAEVGLTKQ